MSSYVVLSVGYLILNLSSSECECISLRMSALKELASILWQGQPRQAGGQAAQAPRPLSFWLACSHHTARAGCERELNGSEANAAKSASP
eukprot:scaffold38134_cov28-Prasinocladus_malaysianus.AAC.1